MDQVGFLRFTANGKSCLGTSDLNSCTAVAIVSSKAAILAHIAPRPSDRNKSQATGDDHVKAKMKEVRDLLVEHQSDFTNQGSDGVLVYAVYQGKVALEDQVKIIGAQLNAWKLPTTPVRYQVLEAKQDRGPAKGTVLIDARGQKPVVWVEDTLATKAKSVGSSAAESSKSGTR
ncbi:hypothetical protein HO173_011040 [Letharia columbiana]|uniref:Uncharacterized protein n=1 Tax=Letharia columbiana TaxID=112416 RepID=A0A8H6FLF5_9LECA|nr:uncharacterized protein HO173_011040 [Letharia columbiana]KAF6230688.1 hypothetical protein HO173_011040 [Letharia columbiana]